MTARTDRIDELLRQEIGGLLSREVKDPRIGFATVTKVETTADLAHARVWVSVIGSPAERTETVRALEHAMPFVRHELGSRLRLRRIPNLHIRLDESAETGTRVLHLIEELERGNTPQTEAPLGETLPTPVIRRHREGDAEPEPVADDASAQGGGAGLPGDLIVPLPPVNRAARRGRCRGSGNGRPTNRTAGSRRPGR
ncbi:MAG TPA: 30S ribosome-binding factor RbfA [Candidatus Limnocylindrales bacterium]|nr:30S ribosome-binding factor RbfA [Candidatus Limnocylindrales bacterium]